MASKAHIDCLRIYDQVSDLPEIWDHVATMGGLGLDRRFLSAIEQSLDNCSRRYLVFEKPSGAAVIAVADLLGRTTTRDPIMSIMLGRLSSRFRAARRMVLPLMLLSCDVSSDSPILVNAFNKSERQKLLAEMLDALSSRADREGWTLAVTGLRADNTELAETLCRHGYLRTMGRPFAELRLRFDSWNNYLKSAKSRSKSAASTIRQENNRAAREGLRIVEWDPEEVPERELYRLVNEHERRLNKRPIRFHETFFSDLSDRLGSDLRILLAKHHECIRGTVVFARAGVRGYVLFPGFVPKSTRTASEYFNLVYYEPIRLGIDLGLHSLAYGNAAFAAKIRRGCHVVETDLFLRPRMRLLAAGATTLMGWHRRLLARKYARVLNAKAFANIS